MAVDKVMTAATLTRAKLHVYNVCNSGQSITLVKPGTKDEFGTILNESTLSLKAHPVRYAPFDRQVAQDISWTENVDVIAYVSKKELDDSSLTVTDIKQYLQLRVGNKDYKIKKVEYFSAFYNDFLYLLVGASI